MEMRVFRALTPGTDTKISDSRYTYELNGMHLDPPLPATLAADVREVFSRLAVPYRVPFSVRKLRSDYSSACICDGIIEVIYFQNCLPDVGDAPRDHYIKADAVSIRRCRGKAGESGGSRNYILFQHNIKMEGEAPIEARLLDIANRTPKPQVYALLKGHKNDPWDQ